MVLAGSLIWILTRPAAEPVPAASDHESAASVTAEPAELTLDPALTRTAVPTEAERKRALLESVPHTSLRVRVQDPYGALLAAPCTVSLEVMMSTGREARGRRTLDEKGECWFEILPAGECMLTLTQSSVPGVPGRIIHSQRLSLVANQPAIQSVDLSEVIVMVDLQCVNPPRGGLEEVELLQGNLTLAEWTSEDPAAGLQPGPLSGWAPVGAEFEARFRTVDEEYVEQIQFHEPGRHSWLIELPKGELQVLWPPSGGLDKFILESEPFPAGARNPSTCFSEGGRGSFYWLPQGRYVVRAGTVVRGKFLEKARSPVEIGADLVELTLVSAPSGSLRFTVPALPTEAPAGRAPGGKYGGHWPEAFLYPVGERWPLYGRKTCTKEEDRFFADLLVGEYELLITQAGWASVTPITIAAGVETSVRANDWRGLTNLHLQLTPYGGPDAEPLVWYTTAEGQRLRIQPDGVAIVDRQAAWSYRARVPPGIARLIVMRGDGAQNEFEIVVADQAEDVHLIRLPD
jgi:hypothetical protein